MQLSLISSESHSFECIDPSISLIFAQSHSNLTHFQQQSTIVVNIVLVQEAKYIFRAPVVPHFTENPQIFLSCVLIVRHFNFCISVDYVYHVPLSDVSYLIVFLTDRK